MQENDHWNQWSYLFGLQPLVWYNMVYRLTGMCTMGGESTCRIIQPAKATSA